MADGFVHLHNHTEYSMLDGAARVEELVAAAVADGQRALGITDHGNLYGRDRVLRRLPGGRGDPGARPGGLHGRRLALQTARRAGARWTTPAATPRAGASSTTTSPCSRSATRATATCGRSARWRSWRATTTSPASTGSCSSATPRGSSPRPAAWAGSCCRRCWPATTRARATWPRACSRSSAARTSSSSSRTTAWPSRRAPTPTWCASRSDLGAPLLATNDLHYVRHGDAEMHDALLCVGTGSLVADPNRFRFHSDQHYLKTAAEMRHLFAELPEACDNTVALAERAEVTIEFDNDALPEFPLPAGVRARAPQGGGQRVPARPGLRRRGRALRRPPAGGRASSGSTTSSASSTTWASRTTSWWSGT